MAWNGEGWGGSGIQSSENRIKGQSRMENRKVTDTKQGSWKQTWVKGEQGLEFQYGVAQSVTENTRRTYQDTKIDEPAKSAAAWKP